MTHTRTAHHSAVPDLIRDLHHVGRTAPAQARRSNSNRGKA